jgi:membrane dipeptidase
VGVISSSVDRLLHTTAVPTPGASRRARALHSAVPVVDLVVGTALFRQSLIEPTSRGHVDLRRLRAGGVNIVGLTMATRFPDLRGSLSRFQFRSLGAPAAVMGSNMALAEWLIERVGGWCESSAGELRLLRYRRDLEACLTANGPVGVFIGVQGAHVLDGQLGNVGRLKGLGVRMLAPAHVMDNRAVGSSTGRLRRGLSGLGRELIAELERQRMLVDLAHMSSAGIDDGLAIVTRPPLISHAGLLSRNSRGSRWRRYSPATRNVADAQARAVAAAGGVVGIVLSTQLLGGDSVDDAVRGFQAALDACGPAGVAIGSDMDGGLRTVVDAAGLPALTDGLLTAGVTPDTLRGILGENALRLLRPTLAD